METFYR